MIASSTPKSKLRKERGRDRRKERTETREGQEGKTSGTEAQDKRLGQTAKKRKDVRCASSSFQPLPSWLPPPFFRPWSMLSYQIAFFSFFEHASTLSSLSPLRLHESMIPLSPSSFPFFVYFDEGWFRARQSNFDHQLWNKNNTQREIIHERNHREDEWEATLKA